MFYDANVDDGDGDDDDAIIYGTGCYDTTDGRIDGLDFLFTNFIFAALLLFLLKLKSVFFLYTSF